MPTQRPCTQLLESGLAETSMHAPSDSSRCSVMLMGFMNEVSADHITTVHLHSLL